MDWEPEIQFVMEINVELYRFEYSSFVSAWLNAVVCRRVDLQYVHAYIYRYCFQ